MDHQIYNISSCDKVVHIFSLDQWWSGPNDRSPLKFKPALLRTQKAIQFNEVLMFPLQNLICCLGILLQINGITPYTTTSTVFCTFHIQIHSFHWLIYKTFFCMYRFSCQCNITFLSTNTLQKVL